jgi:hypothetical protein
LEACVLETQIYTYVDLLCPGLGNGVGRGKGMRLTGPALWILSIAIGVITILITVHHDQVVEVCITVRWRTNA